MIQGSHNHIATNCSPTRTPKLLSGDSGTVLSIVGVSVFVVGFFGLDQQKMVGTPGCACSFGLFNRPTECHHHSANNGLTLSNIAFKPFGVRAG